MATHRDCALHTPTPGHPERPSRLEAAVAGSAAAGAVALTVEIDESRALAAIATVHAQGYAGRLREASRSGPHPFDGPDTPAAPGTFEAAVAAVGSVLCGVDAILAGRSRVAWCPVRPPGHHAMRDRALGFCYFNNVAIAAEELLAHGVGPLAVVDFDVHHGNGTQAHFWQRDDVYFASIHRYPFYPGSGGADEIGAGAGRGYTRNFPLAAGADDEIYAGALEAALDEVVTAIRPAAWLISAGFDADARDPLGGMRVTEAGYGTMGRLLRATTGTSPVIAVLEGGYDLEALRGSVQTFLRGLADIGTP